MGQMWMILSWPLRVLLSSWYLDSWIFRFPSSSASFWVFLSQSLEILRGRKERRCSRIKERRWFQLNDSELPLISQFSINPNQIKSGDDIFLSTCYYRVRPRGPLEQTHLYSKSISGSGSFCINLVLVGFYVFISRILRIRSCSMQLVVFHLYGFFSAKKQQLQEQTVQALNKRFLFGV